MAAHDRDGRLPARVSTVAAAIASLGVSVALALGAVPAAAAPAAAPERVPTRDWAPISGTIGWSACAPVTWSLDPGALSPAMARRQVPALTWAFEQWSRVSGLRFSYEGFSGTAYDDAAQDLRPADGRARSRHVYLTWLRPATAAALAGSTSGFAAPSMVRDGEILTGRAVFKASYVASMTQRDPRRIRALYLHEIGHVLGLGHAAHPGNRMYPIVDDGTALGAGDIAGVRALTRPCAP